MTEAEVLKSALKKVESQQENLGGFMDRFDISEHWAVREALEKQIAIPHHHTKVDEIKDCHIRLSICPKCLYGTYSAEFEYPQYCSWCGQKLDWGEVR